MVDYYLLSLPTDNLRQTSVDATVLQVQTIKISSKLKFAMFDCRAVIQIIGSASNIGRERSCFGEPNTRWTVSELSTVLIFSVLMWDAAAIWGHWSTGGAIALCCSSHEYNVPRCTVEVRADREATTTVERYEWYASAWRPLMYMVLGAPCSPQLRRAVIGCHIINRYNQW